MVELSKTPMILKQGMTRYEERRTKFFNRDETGRFPSEIHLVESCRDVVNALQRARESGLPVSVKSGGHLASKPSLVQGGILIDTERLNRKLDYDPSTHEVSFGPAVSVYEAWKALDEVGRFFPFGHAPDVALGGFCLAGGQGFFMKGWGATVTSWILKLEIVVPDGQILIASRTEHQDLFWAARGSGQAFFGVVTRIWSRTIPSKHLFGRSMTFRVGERFEDILSFAFDRSEAMPKLFTESAICTMHSELFDTEAESESIPVDSPLLMIINISAYADTLEEAEGMLRVWDEFPDNLRGCLVESNRVGETDWDEFFKLQHTLNPQTPDQKWGINSILNDIDVPREKLLKTIKPALCNLPTRSSYGCIYVCDTVNPDEKDAVFSLPQQYYISTFTGWKNDNLKSSVQDTVGRSYREAQSVACGMYVADFDQSAESCHSKNIPVWSNWAHSRFMEIREKWDPNGIFTGFKAFHLRN